LGFCLALCACAAPDPSPQPFYSPRHAVTMQAYAECAGPFVPWSQIVDHTPWPYRTTVTETLRCMKDGRVIGPFTYRADGL
jgi:hypothetical protein